MKVRVTGPRLQDVRSLKSEYLFPAALDSEDTLIRKGSNPCENLILYICLT